MAHAPLRAARVHLVTLSDTRTPADDESGRLCRELVTGAGHAVVGQDILPDDGPGLRRRAEELAADTGVDVVITNGGTGLAARDTTVDALGGLFTRRIDGFGELFRALSFADVGPRAMFSRACAGTRGRVVFFALPGSPAAVRLGLERLILPELGHLVAEMHK